MTIRVTVWGENVHERKNKVVAEVYPHHARHHCRRPERG
jgi:trehalose utilization protein